MGPAGLIESSRRLPHPHEAPDATASPRPTTPLRGDEPVNTGPLTGPNETTWPVRAAHGHLTVVVTASSIGAAKGGGYARCLEGKTVQRGDYQPTRSPGHGG